MWKRDVPEESGCYWVSTWLEGKIVVKLHQSNVFGAIVVWPVDVNLHSIRWWHHSPLVPPNEKPPAE